MSKNSSPKGYSGFLKSGLLNVVKVKRVARGCLKPGDNNQHTKEKNTRKRRPQSMGRLRAL